MCRARLIIALTLVGCPLWPVTAEQAVPVQVELVRDTDLDFGTFTVRITPEGAIRGLRWVMRPPSGTGMRTGLS